MTFEEKVKFLRSLPQFKVIPTSELRAIAFATGEANEFRKGDFVLGRTASTVLILTSEDIEKILRVYPNLEVKLR